MSEDVTKDVRSAAPAVEAEHCSGESVHTNSRRFRPNDPKSARRIVGCSDGVAGVKRDGNVRQYRAFHEQSEESVDGVRLIASVQH